MRILLDHGTPRGLARWLEGHTVSEARAEGWDMLSNGELLKEAGDAGFDVLVTTDKNLPYQQKLTGRKLAVVVLSTARWRLIEARVTQVVAAVNAARPGNYTFVDTSES